ncbi:xanthine dehydrogenase small subunit [Pelagibacterium lacus]|uniref:Xanthine dehydrogenase small subunit n=1 Tax=Pelagibacterium lacus TaxID=2282655 RepID=A0A369W7Z5_9HYPH|nr:xanthine dehydrogenase small subunit [Pelagibacterium lacus]RDE10089.1 xanthine dehydrogenase small subunit [Pelagibacterium lacus]
MSPRHAIRFYLNGELVILDDVAPDLTILDYLRVNAMLRGTKEGCAEGDCGACTVLVGRLTGEDGGEEKLQYQAINSCIRFLATLDGCDLVTVDHLSTPDGALHPVQEAMVDKHGSQCGFCTPGFVMALYAMWLNGTHADRESVLLNLQNNLCRCTGYRPIVDAALSISDYGNVDDDPLVRSSAEALARLRDLKDGKRVVIESANGRLFLPADADDLAAILAEHPEATIAAGTTDVGLWVTKMMRSIAPVVFIGHLDDLRGITVTPDAVEFGATVTYEDARPAVESHFPALVALWDRIAGTQIRNMGTICGNIANGSPIGDTPPPLIALGAEIVLRKGNVRRAVRLEDFFIAYGRQDRQPGEFVESVRIPRPDPQRLFATYKVSKRRDEDITAVLGAFNLRIEDGVVREAAIAYGGMAGIPCRARRVEAALLGQPWTLATVERAMTAYEDDFQPLSDWRASADYRMTVARNLLMRFYLASLDKTDERLAAGGVL